MKKIGIGRALSLTGILILAVGLVCNGFELLPAAGFRIVVLAGILVQAAALFLILKKSEF